MIVGLSGCANRFTFRADTEKVSGPLLVWYTWPEPESQIILTLLSDFMRVYPAVTIVSEYVPSSQLDDVFVEQMAAGLGPDLIIGAELKFIYGLVEQELLYSLSSDDVTTNMLPSQAVDALMIEDQLYGIPFAAYTNVLFFNRELVESPASTIDMLLDEAKSGVPIAIPTDFYNAYWGIHAFGGELIDEKGQIAVDDKAAEWLQWLLDAQKAGVFLSPDYEELRQFFTDGNVAYFVGDSSELPHLQEQLGEEQVGVALLPHREIEDEEELEVAERIAQPAAPGAFLELEVISVSKISAQKELAFEVIEFFVNQTHQREIAKADFGQLPINRSVRIDPRFSPNESVLIRQGSNGVIIPLKDIVVEDALIAVGTDVFNQVLEGVVSPADAVEMIHQGVEERLQSTKTLGE